uniref:Hydroxyacyl-coenzyme A dehydrogenase, mitochondrial-like n=1 Tax=Diabrotica virgifera virgifera TaxID=50390 RepID=A0A6P7FM04_DIAVI
MKNVIQTITVFGGGKIGSGLVQIAAQNAKRVVLVETNQEQLKKSAERLITNLAKSARELYKEEYGAKKYIEQIMGFITGTTDPTKAVIDADLVIEAIPERLDKKQELFKRIDKAASPKTIFASTTNSFSIGSFAENSTRIQRFVGLHFFYPVPETKLVEIVKVSVTSKETLDSVTAWCKDVGKTPVICNDSAGFIVNRLLLSYITEAIRMTERADATAEDIDIAMKLATGSSMGPIQLADHLGHDKILNLLAAWKSREPNNDFLTPSPSQKLLVQQGKLGTKTGEGYYKYNDLKHWITNYSHRFKNKQHWLKHYQLWKKNCEKEILQN